MIEVFNLESDLVIKPLRTRALDKYTCIILNLLNTFAF